MQHYMILYKCSKKQLKNLNSKRKEIKHMSARVIETTFKARETLRITTATIRINNNTAAIPNNVLSNHSQNIISCPPYFLS